MEIIEPGVEVRLVASVFVVPPLDRVALGSIERPLEQAAFDHATILLYGIQDLAPDYGLDIHERVILAACVADQAIVPDFWNLPVVGAAWGSGGGVGGWSSNKAFEPTNHHLCNQFPVGISVQHGPEYAKETAISQEE